jgi:hypothetical protein
MDDIIINTEEQNEAALAELLEETRGKDKRTDRELGYIYRLTRAIEKFESEHYPLGD